MVALVGPLVALVAWPIRLQVTMLDGMPSWLVVHILLEVVALFANFADLVQVGVAIVRNVPHQGVVYVLREAIALFLVEDVAHREGIGVNRPWLIRHIVALQKSMDYHVLLQVNEAEESIGIKTSGHQATKFRHNVAR